MKRSSYRDRDHVFGQLMLTLRTVIGLTQAGLANVLGFPGTLLAGGRLARRIPKPIISNM